MSEQPIAHTETLITADGEATGLTASDLLRCNQYLIAEQIPPGLLGRFYDTRALDRYKPSTAGWRHIELGMHDPGHLEKAQAELRDAEKTARQQGDLTSYGDSVFGSAYLPAFAARAEGRAPSKDMLVTLATKLTDLLIDDTLDIGEKTTSVVLLLGVRRAIHTGHTSTLLYPSSPREGRNTLRTVDQKKCNHDCYPLDRRQRQKTPIEVKLNNGGGYAPDVFEFRLAYRIADVIKDHGLYPDDPKIQRWACDPKRHSAALLGMAIRAFTGMEGDELTSKRLLTALENRFWNLVKEHRKINPAPGCEFPRPEPYVLRFEDDAPPAEQPVPREQIRANGASMGSVAEAVIAILENLPMGELQAAADRLTAAQQLLGQAALGSSVVGETAEELGVPTEQLHGAISALAASRERLSKYLRQTGVSLGASALSNA